MQPSTPGTAFSPTPGQTPPEMKGLPLSTPAPSATKDTPAPVAASTPRMPSAGGQKPKPRPASKLHQRSKGDNAVERLEKLLTAEGLLEYTAVSKEKDDTASVSENHTSPMNKKKQDDRLSQGLRKTRAAAQKPNEKDGRASRFMDRIRAGSPDRRNFKEIEALIDIQEKEKARLQAENDMLREVALIAQQTSLLNESRLHEEMRSLEAKLHAAVTNCLEDSEKMNTIRLHNRRIQDGIASMRGIAERQAQVEKDNLVRAFHKQIELKALELEEERRSGQNTTGEWVAKNQELQEQINTILNTTEDKHDINKALIEQHKALTVEYKAQAEDDAFLKKQFDALRKLNAALKDRIQELEAQMLELTKPASASTTEKPHTRSLVAPPSPSPPPDQKQERFEEALERLKKLSEIERRNLGQVKAAQTYTLSMRTELEIQLRHAIRKVQEDILEQKGLRSSPVRHDADGISPTKEEAAKPFSPTNGDVSVPLAELTAADRRRVIEMLLSKERVLHLLYAEDKPQVVEPVEDGTSPKSGALGATDQSFLMQLFSEESGAKSPSSPSTVQVYAKWKSKHTDTGPERVAMRKTL
eukprot:GGOE01014263.1.p1 GENE.GGOE01014263.1~~GGOE01014263.1.p1  ORF type:complete len:634 (-),score=199.69 GGOE01014263.1:117-1874(-)